MGSDSDYDLRSSPMAESSFSELPRKLKRLKKCEDVLRRSESVAFTPISLDSSGKLFSDPLHEPAGNNLDFGIGNGMVKRALDFDSIEKELYTIKDDGPSKIVGEVSDPSTDMLEKKQNDDFDTHKRKSKREFEIEEPTMKIKKKKTNNDENKHTATIKKMTEKERKNQLQQLHAESQRLIRETSDLLFKPAPVVQKPINSILEKIRKRKSEVTKKPSFSNNNLFSNDIQMSANMEGDGKLVEESTEDMSVLVTDLKNDKSIRYSDSTSVPLRDELVDEFKKNNGDSLDTQDTFSKPEAHNDSIEDSSEEHSGMGEVFAPSVLAMNLKLDPVPRDDECSSSDEDDNDKENVAPFSHGFHRSNSSENADPVKEFLDDEAEEDDSDNDLRPQQSEEDSDSDNAEDFNDLIATGHEENKEDNEKRNQLHQKWLEQQDVNGTENFLQRLKYGSKLRESFLDVDDENQGSVYEEFSNKSLMDDIANDSAGANSRKIKEMIPQMFTDKDDKFLSSDEEETEKRHAKLRARLHDDVFTTFSNAQEDDSSSEVFGLIKKLNVIPATKKNTKVTGFFDMSLGGSSSSFSKQSFVGRSSNRSLSSSHKQGSINARRFIFGRDDSNSMDAVSLPEDLHDKIENENQEPKTKPNISNFGNLKFKKTLCSSSGTNSKGGSMGTNTTPSLFKILRQSASLHSGGCSADGTFSESVFSALRCTATANSRSARDGKM